MPALGLRTRAGEHRFVGFSFLSEARAFLDTFCVFLLAAGERRSLVEMKKRLPFVGVGVERATAVVMLSVCAMSVCAMSV